MIMMMMKMIIIIIIVMMMMVPKMLPRSTFSFISHTGPSFFSTRSTVIPVGILLPTTDAISLVATLDLDDDTFNADASVININTTTNTNIFIFDY